MAELIAAHAVTKELQWTINMLQELGFSLPITPILHQDNMSTIQIFHQPGNSGKTKHISLRYNIVRELCANGTIKVQYLPTEEMIADILTKAVTQATLVDRLSREQGMICPSLATVKSSIWRLKLVSLLNIQDWPPRNKGLKRRLHDPSL